MNLVRQTIRKVSQPATTISYSCNPSSLPEERRERERSRSRGHSHQKEVSPKCRDSSPRNQRRYEGCVVKVKVGGLSKRRMDTAKLYSVAATKKNKCRDITFIEENRRHLSTGHKMMIWSFRQIYEDIEYVNPY